MSTRARPAAFAPGEGHYFECGICTRCGVPCTSGRVRLLCPTGVLYNFDEPQGRFDFARAAMVAVQEIFQGNQQGKASKLHGST